MAWWWRRDRRFARYVLPAVALCAALLPLADGAAAQLQEPLGLASVPRPVIASVMAVAALIAAWVAPVRRWPLFVVAVVDAALRGSGLLVAVASYLAATAFRRPAHLVSYAVAASVLMLLPLSDAELLSSLAGAPVYVWLPLALGLWADARRQMMAALRERAERLEREQTARAERARTQERARIARDMHDVVAHRVSLMVLHAGALEINAPDERTASQAELIRTTGREALGQLRSVLGVLSEPERERIPSPHGADTPVEPQPTLTDLEWLLEQSRSAGVPVVRRDEGAPYPLPVMAEHTAYRVVQEALTNIHKHAGKVATQVVVHYLPRSLHITVENDAAHGNRPALPGSGSGLIGLRERVELQGGEFVARPATDGGFLVSARLPT